MSDVDEDLRATAESISAEARRLAAIEERKLEMDPADPLIPVLSAESQAISKRLVIQTTVEKELATTLAEEQAD